MVKKIKVKSVLISLFLLTFLSGILLIPNTPTEMDSIIYAMELRQDISGIVSLSTFSYNKPLYFLFNYLSHLFINLFGNFSLLQAIAYTSVLFGSLSSILVFLLVKLLTKKEDISLLAALLFSFSPVIIWYRSLPLSELPSLSFVLLTFVLLLKYRENKTILLLISSLMIYGLSLLVRFSNLFFLPLLLTTFGYLLYEKRKLYLFPLSSLMLLPITLYVLVVTRFFYPSYSINYFFITSAQHTILLSNLFNFKLWVALVYQIINGYTITASVFALIGILMLLSCFSTKQREFYLKLFLFSILWALPIIYNLANAVLIARYIIFLIPMLSLFASYGIIYLYKRATSFRSKIYIFISILVLSFLDFALNYVPVAKYYYQSIGLMPLIFSFVENVNISYLFLFILIIVVTLSILNYLKVSLKLSFSILIILVMLLHAFPLSALLKQKTHYMYTIGDWYGKNIMHGSVIIAGQEILYDRFFLTDVEIIEYRGIYYKLSKSSDIYVQKNIILDKITSSLLEGKKVFISNDHYVLDLLEDLRKKYTLTLKVVIPKNSLRNYRDPNGIFMNYASFFSSDDVNIYEIKNY